MALITLQTFADYWQRIYDWIGSSLSPNININSSTTYIKPSLSAGALNADLLASTDVGNYAVAVVQVTGSFVGTLTFQGSNDNTNWFNILASNLGSTAAISATTTTTGMFAVPLGFKYLRVRMTAYTSGTATGAVTLDCMPSEAANLYANVSGSVSITAMPTPSISTINSAATTNSTLVKASAGTVYNVTASNIAASIRCLKFYNKASAPTVGTDIPILVIPIAAGGIINLDFGNLGARFTLGIALAITGAMADTDTTVIAASDVKVITAYV